MPLNKQPTKDLMDKMAADRQEELKAEKKERPKKLKPRNDIGPGNPMLRLRHAIKPTPEEVENRSPRDKRKKFLLQRELADRIPCSTSTVRYAERYKRFPIQRGVYECSVKLYQQYFPETDDNAVSRVTGFFATPSAREFIAKKKKRRNY